MCDENLRAFLSLPYCMVGSDSSARSFDGPTRRGKPHPRGFGTMPRFLRMASDGKLGAFDGSQHDALSYAIHKMTALPARTFGLTGRGEISPGMRADIVVFDPRTVRDTATFESPFMKPGGIAHVIVNGTVAVHDATASGKRAGRVLRGGTDSA